MKILVINGPNLNLLGSREPAVYGRETYEDLVIQLEAFAEKKGCAVEIAQFNGEGEIIDAIQAAAKENAFNGIIINPGAYTHYSYAIHDAIKAVNVPAVEVHISNISGREEFRQKSVIAPACVGQISGLGFYGYKAAIAYFCEQKQQ